MPLTPSYQQYCLTGAIKPALMWGCFWSVADAARGEHVTPRSVGKIQDRTILVEDRGMDDLAYRMK